jgi:AcrR family transcriptional regulator
VRNTDTKAIRERILQTSAELFAENGYHATGLAELCSAVGLGRGAFYYHIESKETLLYEICSGQVERMNAYAAECVARPLPSDQRLRLLARGLMTNIAEHRAQWAVFFREFNSVTGDRRELLVAARERYEDYWQRTVREGIEAGIFVPTMTLQVKGILGMFNYSYLWFNPEGSIAPTDAADAFVDVIFYGLVRPQRQAAPASDVDMTVASASAG